jgi:AraC-like DNA-binding protein
MESFLISRSSRIASDPLSDVLSLLKPQGYMSGGVDAGGEWCFQFDKDEYFRCFALMQGHCWLAMEGLPDAIRLEAGDFVVIPHGGPFRLASDLRAAPVDIMTVVQAPLNGRIVSWQGGGACLAISSLFTFAGEHASILLEVLPRIVHIRNDAEREAMRWYLERMMKVLREPEPGAVLLGEHLAQMMLIEILRLHLADIVKGGTGWLFALADKQMGPAITAMHESPGYRWTLRELAGRAGMSRSAFAQRFKEKVGSSAMEYLTRWRMLRAADRLMESRDSVSTIALSLGYESESAFGFAFKREMGCSPRQYCRATRGASLRSEPYDPGLSPE